MGGAGAEQSASASRAAARGPRSLALRAVRRTRRAQRGIVGRARRREVWYLASPPDVIVRFGSRLSRVDTRHLTLVLLSHGDPGALARQVNAELASRLSEAEVVQAGLRELTAAASHLGVRREPLWVDGTDLVAGGDREVAAFVRDLAREHPTALHVFPPADHYGPALGTTIRAMAVRSMKHSLAVVRLTDDAAPAALTPDVTSAADEFRHWDPDNGRYAVHRTAISRHLLHTTVGGGQGVDAALVDRT